MSLEQFLALTTLALVGSFTPGPNTTIATVTGANYGFRAAVPHMFGVPFGFSTMLAAGALGVAALLLAHPVLSVAIKWIGVTYLLYIAWQMARPRPATAAPDRATIRPFSFWQSAAFQYANPKAWMLVAATVGTFMSSGSTVTGTAIIVTVFAVAAFLSLILWAWVGAALRSWLLIGSRMQVFNLVMGVLLAATALWLLTQ
jgi:threonine/homoserine/homoserine lactone efflux protein